jgi:hypothetical protein
MRSAVSQKRAVNPFFSVEECSRKAAKGAKMKTGSRRLELRREAQRHAAF